MRSLVVDDDFVCRSTLLAQLLPYGSCDAAANGREALLAVGRAHGAGWTYDLVCLDIEMPDMSGQGVLRAMRQQEDRQPGAPRAKVIMTTAHSEPNQVKTAFINRSDGFLVKPVRAEQLRARLQALGLLPA
jgi:two-component system chemotaxis response regulator CheY